MTVRHQKKITYAMAMKYSTVTFVIVSKLHCALISFVSCEVLYYLVNVCGGFEYCGCG